MRIGRRRSRYACHQPATEGHFHDVREGDLEPRLQDGRGRRTKFRELADLERVADRLGRPEASGSRDLRSSGPPRGAKEARTSSATIVDRSGPRTGCACRGRFAFRHRVRPAPGRCHDSGSWRLLGPVATSPRAAGSRSWTASPGRWQSRARCHLLDRRYLSTTAASSRSRGRERRRRRRVERLVAAALREIDMERQSGEHPARGCGAVRAARRHDARRVRGPRPRLRAPDRHPLRPPRAAAATRPERVRLADVRRGEYEGLRDETAAGTWDFGPARMHPRGGASGHARS